MARDPQRRRDLLVGRCLGRPQHDLTPLHQPARGHRAGCVLAQPRLIFAGQYGTRCDVHSTNYPQACPSRGGHVVLTALHYTSRAEGEWPEGCDYRATSLGESLFLGFRSVANAPGRFLAPSLRDFLASPHTILLSIERHSGRSGYVRQFSATKVTPSEARTAGFQFVRLVVFYCAGGTFRCIAGSENCGARA